MCVNFQLKRTAVTFLAQICPKRKLGFQIQKTNVGIRISILQIPCVPIFRQKGQLWILGPNLPKNGFLFRNFKNLSLDSESVSLRYYVYQFSKIGDNFEFLGPNLPKNEFWGQNFKNLSLDSESASLRYYVHQFSDKTDNFEFLGPNLHKNGFCGRNFKNLSLDSDSTPPKYHVCQFSVKMDNLSFFDLNLEVEGAGWSWVKVGAQFSNTHFH